MLTCFILQISQSSDVSDVEEGGSKRIRTSARLAKIAKKLKTEAHEAETDREVYLEDKIARWLTEIETEEGEAQS